MRPSVIRRERSANSHCITLENAIDVTPASVPGAKQSFAVSGTPADCVMLALSGPVFSPQVRKRGPRLRPDSAGLLLTRHGRTLPFAQVAGSIRLVISGINRGHNAGLHVVYSGVQLILSRSCADRASSFRGMAKPPVSTASIRHIRFYD